jgi:hypothetical protein
MLQQRDWWGLFWVPGLLAAVYPGLKAGILNKGFFGDMTLSRLIKVNEWVVIVPLSAILVLIMYLLERAGL